MNSKTCVHRYVDYKNAGAEVSCPNRAINAQHGWLCRDHQHICDHKPRLVFAPAVAFRSLTDSILATEKAAIAAGTIRKVRLGGGNYLRILE